MFGDVAMFDALANVTMFLGKVRRNIFLTTNCSLYFKQVYFAVNTPKK